MILSYVYIEHTGVREKCRLEVSCPSSPVLARKLSGVPRILFSAEYGHFKILGGLQPPVPPPPPPPLTPMSMWHKNICYLTIKYMSCLLVSNGGGGGGASSCPLQGTRPQDTPTAASGFEPGTSFLRVQSLIHGASTTAERNNIHMFLVTPSH